MDWRWQYIPVTLAFRKLWQEDLGAILEIIEILFQKEKFLTHCSIVGDLLPQIHDTITPCGHTLGGQWPLYKHRPVPSVLHSVMQELLPVYG